MSRLVLALLLLTPACSLLAQHFRDSVPELNSPNLPAQKIGPEDLIAVSVYGAPELSRTIRIPATSSVKSGVTRAAKDGVDALAHLERRLYDVLVMDNHMPSLNGLYLLTIKSSLMAEPPSGNGSGESIVPR